MITIARMTFCFHYYSSSDNFIFFLILLFVLLFRSNWFIFTVQSICSKKRNVYTNQSNRKFLKSITISFHHRRTVGSSIIHVAMYLSVRFILQTTKTRSRLHLDIVLLLHSNDVWRTFSTKKKKKDKVTLVLLKVEIILDFACCWLSSYQRLRFFYGCPPVCSVGIEPSKKCQFIIIITQILKYVSPDFS